MVCNYRYKFKTTNVFFNVVERRCCGHESNGIVKELHHNDNNKWNLQQHLNVAGRLGDDDDIDIESSLSLRHELFIINSHFVPPPLRCCFPKWDTLRKLNKRNPITYSSTYAAVCRS